MRLLRLFALVFPAFLHDGSALAVALGKARGKEVSELEAVDVDGMTCTQIVDTIQAALKKAKQKAPLWFKSYQSMLSALSLERTKGADKAIEAAISTFFADFKNPTYLDLERIEQLSVCGMDDDGNTVLMKIIRLGLANSVENPKTWTLFLPGNTTLPLDGEQTNADEKEELTPAAVLLFVNDKRDNLLHLAVRSGSDLVVNSILKNVQERFGSATLKGMFEAENAGNETPVQLALSSPSIHSLLSSHYRTLFLEQ